MAGSVAVGLVLGLAALTFALRAAGPFMSHIPTAVTDRTPGLAPALLSALVVIQLTNAHGFLRFDVKAAAVIVAALLSAIRVPLVACVAAGALTAAVLRVLGHG